MIPADEACNRSGEGDERADVEGRADPCLPAGPNQAQMRILRDGTWLYQGTPIAREKMVRLFATILRREADGSFWLVTPVERVGVEVEDAPFVALEMRREGTGRGQVLSFRTNLDEWIPAGEDHALRVEEAQDSGEPRPYIHLRRGLEALIARSVFYELVELAETVERDGRELLGLWSRNIFFPLGRL